MSMTNVNRSIPEIFSDLIGQLTTLVRKEGQLARTEISEKISSAAGGLTYVAAGAVLIMPALVILLGAMAAALVESGMSSALAALIVGGATLVIGVVLLMTGMGRLKAGNLVPEKTIHQLQQDAQVAKQEMSGTHEHRAA